MIKMTNTIDMDAVRKIVGEGTKGDVDNIIEFVGDTYKAVERYVDFARSTGITQHVGACFYPSYEEVKLLIGCLHTRTDLTNEQASKLEDMANFWTEEKDLIRRGFYSGQHIEGVKK